MTYWLSGRACRVPAGEPPAPPDARERLTHGTSISGALRLILSTNGLHAAGGSETYLLTVASHLQRLGHDVTLHANEVDADLAATSRG